MSKRIHYTQDEWLALAVAPAQAALAVMGTSMISPLQIVRELIALGEALRQTAQTPSAGVLVRELNEETQAQLLEISQHPTQTIDLTGLRTPALDACRRVGALVDAKEPPHEAHEYKHWVLWVARRVAAAAREDESEAVSADEAALLAELTEALGAQQRQVAAATEN